MTQKAGQKCTAIRRVLAPPAVAAQRARRPGRPPAGGRRWATRRRRACAWGRWPRPSSSRTCAQGIDLLAARRAARLRQRRRGAGRWARRTGKGFFVAPGAGRGGAGRGRARPSTRTRSSAPWPRVVPYSGRAEDAAEIVARGGGGLVSSVYSEDTAFTVRGGARPRALPRPRLPGQREDRGGLAGPGHRAARSWCTAGPGARAAARSWAACAASPSTCSAWPSRARGR